MQQRGVIALRRFGDGRAVRIRRGAPPPGGERLDGGQFGGAVKLQGAAVRVLLRQGQAAALALAADGAGLVLQKLGARGFVVFRAFGQRVFDRFAAVFRSGLRADRRRPRRCRRTRRGCAPEARGAALVRLRQPEAVVSRRRSAARKKVFFIIIQRKRYRYRSLSCMSALCSS